MPHSYADHVEAHTKSVVLGGARVLFPVPEALTAGFAQQIKLAIRAAEAAAYERGRSDTLADIRRTLGMT